MRAFDVCIEQDEPENVQETIMILAHDITEVMVIGHDLIDSIREELVAEGCKASDFNNLRISAINEQSVVMNKIDGPMIWDKGQVKILAKIIKIQVD